ncbi:unnamed protein product, partial [marine sediment metagenome]
KRTICAENLVKILSRIPLNAFKNPGLLIFYKNPIFNNNPHKKILLGFI